MLVLNFLCVERIPFYHTSLLQVFQLLFIQAKTVNHCEGYVSFLGIEHQLQENVLHHFLHYNFYKALIKIRNISSLLKVIYRQLLWDCPFIQII